jgi:ribosomal silencing factor RsfS
MELENLMQQFNSDNHKHSIPFQVTDAAKLNVIVKETNEETEKERWVLKESRAICLTS